MPIRISRNGRATRLNDAGNDCDRRGDIDAALALYAEAARAQPLWAVPWFNRGLVFKYAGDWAASLEANEQALRRDPAHQGAIWNVGIAATALGRWDVARAMWQRYGIQLKPAESTESECAFGPYTTPIRVSLKGAPEVVWTDRIDPARAIIRSIPTPESGRRYGDLVLHDGAPNGYRRVGQREAAVFDELAVIEASAYETWELELRGVAPDAAADLVQQLAGADVPAEDWGSSLHLLCRACSEGRPDDDPGHDHGATLAPPDALIIGLALQAPTDAERVRSLVLAWPGAQIVRLAPALIAAPEEVVA